MGQSSLLLLLWFRLAVKDPGAIPRGTAMAEVHEEEEEDVIDVLADRFVADAVVVGSSILHDSNQNDPIRPKAPTTSAL